MKRIFILAALLLSSVAQAETWVCSTDGYEKGVKVLSTFTREGDSFTRSVTYPATNSFPSTTSEPEYGRVIFETESLIVLQNFILYHLEEPEEVNVSIHLIHKETNAYIQQVVSFGVAWTRDEGSCVSI